MPDDAASGRLRRGSVEISGTVFHPLAMPQVIEDCFRLLLAKANAIPDPFEQAFFLMVQLPYLQPFEDVNKRVSRIGANIPLIKQNLQSRTLDDGTPVHSFQTLLKILEGVVCVQYLSYTGLRQGYASV